MLKCRIVALLVFCLTAQASMQNATTPIPLQQYTAQEGKGNLNAVTFTGGALTRPENLMDLLALCNAPTAMLYDSNRNGRVDTLKVYGVSRVSSSLWKLRGPNALGPASTKAELAAETYAVKYLQGVAVSSTKMNTSVDTTRESGAAASSGGEESVSTSTLTDVQDTLVQISKESAEGFIRYGRVTGTRTVSLSQGDMCVVVRYELPLDQRPRSAPSSGAGVTGDPASTSGAQKQNAPGYQPLPAGSSGDF